MDTNDMTIKRLEKVLEKLEKYKITYYEVGNNTDLSINSVKKIMDGTTEMPRNSTLTKIENYIAENYERTAIVGEQKEKYENQPADQTLNAIYKRLGHIEALIEHYGLKHEMMFEILKNIKVEEGKVWENHFNEETKS